MKNLPQYNFYKTKYGDELLVDVVSLEDIRKYISYEPVHSLTYYDITLITEGEGKFTINEQTYLVSRGDMIFSKPGDIRSWDPDSIRNGFALIFEEEFLLSFFNDRRFLQQVLYFKMERPTSCITLDEEIWERISYSIQTIRKEIHTYSVKDKHILRAILYEVLMLLNRVYSQITHPTHIPADIPTQHVSKFITLVHETFTENHSTGYYADRLCITPNYLNEIVKTTIGISAKSYIQNRLLLEAKNYYFILHSPFPK